MAGSAPRSLIVAVVLAVLVAAGALAGAAAIRLRATGSAQAVVTSGKAANPVDPSGCVQPPCQVLATATVGGTGIELVGDAGGRSGRLRIGGASTGRVIPATITETGVVLTTDSLQCVAGGPAACLITGRQGDRRIVGQIVVGRSDSWAPGLSYVSNAGYLALANVDGDTAPEILAAQFACANCASGPVRVQVFDIAGSVRCTAEYQGLNRLPGYPVVRLTAADLTPCR